MDDLIKLFEAVSKTPLRTIALVIGFFALSVGYGLKLKAVIDVENINKTYAKTVGAILLVLGITLFIPDITRQPGITDPFLPYYIVCVVIITVFYGVVLRVTNGELQLRAMKGCFLLIATLVTLVVVWRGIADYFYVTSTSHAAPPLGFELQGGNYLPYFILLSAGAGGIAWLIYMNTRRPQNTKYRVTLFKYFSIFCIYLGVCRIAWEVVDLIAKKMLSAQ